MTKVLLATAGYVIGTLVLSWLWYMVLFSSQYQSFDMIEPTGISNFILWIAGILIAGFVISYFYNYLRSDREVAVVKYVSVIAALEWCYTVLANISWIWQEINNLGLFIILATGFVVVQYIIYGGILRWVYGRSSTTQS